MSMTANITTTVLVLAVACWSVYWLCRGIGAVAVAVAVAVGGRKCNDNVNVVEFYG